MLKVDIDFQRLSYVNSISSYYAIKLIQVYILLKASFTTSITQQLTIQ